MYKLARNCLLDGRDSMHSRGLGSHAAAVGREHKLSYPTPGTLLLSALNNWINKR